ncbi:hypothetical protein Q0601_17585 [Paracoccus onubensis]|uniref:hypothetical protein n=1 Tax=Paracoccus onubensis TaxID=1675788 RepID=UPI0027301BE8|nr:hypothetical protein [Paracoccus onubensis]MDP0929000.1 hypothetical protein [Paracoccus onubensis]
MSGIFAILRIIIGGIFGFLSAFALSPAIAAFTNGQSDGSPAYAILIIVAIGVALGFFAPTIRRSFGRGFLILGVCLFALPVSTFLLSGRVANEMITNASAEEQAFAAAGAGLAGVAITGAAAFVGFFLGVIAIVIGLVLSLGGRREVIIIENRSVPPPIRRD